MNKLSDTEKKQIDSQAARVIIELLEKYKVPEQFTPALFEAYRTGATDILSKFLNEEKEVKIMEKTKQKEKKEELVEAIPPEDYKGSHADWLVALQTRGLWDGKNPEWHGDVMISENDWWSILEECENEK